MNLVLMLINNIVSLSEKVALVGQEVKHSLIAAEDLVKLHIKGETGKLQTDTEKLQHTLLEKQGIGQMQGWVILVIISMIRNRDSST